ncbi:MAG: hypothetical protein ABI743_13875 [bacterium]
MPINAFDKGLAITLLVAVVWGWFGTRPAHVPPPREEPRMASWTPGCPEIEATWHPIHVPPEDPPPFRIGWLRCPPAASSRTNDELLLVLAREDLTQLDTFPNPGPIHLYRSAGDDPAQVSPSLDRLMAPNPLGVGDALLVLASNDRFTPQIQTLTVLDSTTFAIIRRIDLSAGIPGHPLDGDPPVLQHICLFPDQSVGVYGPWNGADLRPRSVAVRYHPDTDVWDTPVVWEVVKARHGKAISPHEVLVRTGRELVWRVANIEDGTVRDLTAAEHAYPLREIAPSPMPGTSLTYRPWGETTLPTYLPTAPVPNGWQFVSLDDDSSYQSPRLSIATEALVPQLMVVPALPRYANQWAWLGSGANRFLSAQWNGFQQHLQRDHQIRQVAVPAVWVLRDTPDGPTQTRLPQETEIAVRQTAYHWGSSGLRLFGIDGVSDGVAEVVYPTSKAVANGGGILRIGLLNPPYTAVDWKGYVPLPPDFKQASRGLRISYVPGDDELMFGLEAGWELDQLERRQHFWWVSVPRSIGFEHAWSEDWVAEIGKMAQTDTPGPTP